MMEAMQTYKVTIAGRLYTLVSDEAEREVYAAVQLVDSVLQKVAAQSVTSDVAKLSLLAALDLALKHVQLEQSVAMHADQQAKLMSLLTNVDVEF
jgi:cell division protein ZapA (FtsZ GTPase activity inhibitor)